MANFGQFLVKMGETGFFFKKALGTFFPPLQALTNCQVSEKSNERFLRKSGTNERTDGRTDERGLNSRFLRINIRRTNKSPPPYARPPGQRISKFNYPCDK